MFRASLLICILWVLSQNLFALGVKLDDKAPSPSIIPSRSITPNSSHPFWRWMEVARSAVTYEKFVELVGKPSHLSPPSLPYTTHHYHWFDLLDDGTKRGSALEIHTTVGKDGVERIVGVFNKQDNRVHILYRQIFDAIISKWRMDGTLAN